MNGNHEALDDQIALLRRQLSDLTEAAAAASGARQEENIADSISEKQALLDELLAKREQLPSR